jgi:hypothetical protein
MTVVFAPVRSDSSTQTSWTALVLAAVFALPACEPSSGGGRKADDGGTSPAQPDVSDALGDDAGKAMDNATGAAVRTCDEFLACLCPPGQDEATECADARETVASYRDTYGEREADTYCAQFAGVCNPASSDDPPSDCVTLQTLCGCGSDTADAKMCKTIDELVRNNRLQWADRAMADALSESGCQAFLALDPPACSLDAPGDAGADAGPDAGQHSDAGAVDVPCRSKADCGGAVCEANACGSEGVCRFNWGATCPYLSHCGCDGVTYRNRCDALQAGNVATTLGVCGVNYDVPCKSKADCPRDGVCVSTGCNVEGRCRVRTICPYGGTPVCGCDGEPYQSECEAYVAGSIAALPHPRGTVCGELDAGQPDQ